MAHYKTFPKTVEGSNYPRWEEIELAEKEEKEEEDKCKADNIALMKECIDDAKKIFEEKGLKDFQSDVVNAAMQLFRKRASHSVYWKDNRCKEKFDKLHKNP